jgi:hypothetical protein
LRWISKWISAQVLQLEDLFKHDGRDLFLESTLETFSVKKDIRVRTASGTRGYKTMISKITAMGNVDLPSTIQAKDTLNVRYGPCIVRVLRIPKG